MKKILLKFILIKLIVIALIFLFIKSSFAWNLSEAIDILNKIKSIKSNVEQVNNDGSVLNGNILLKRPGKMSMKYHNYPLQINSNAQSVKIINTNTKQIESYSVNEIPFFKIFSKFSTLEGLKFLEAKEDKSGYEYIHLASINQFAGEIYIYFKNKKLTGWKSKDSNGNFTTIKLIDPKFNVYIEKIDF